MRRERPRQMLKAWRQFLHSPLDAMLEQHTRESAEEAAVAFFQSVAATVPAYRHFLREHGIDPHAISSFADFQGIPVTTKERYLQRHPLPRLCRNGRLETCDIIAVSAGTTGRPTFWPRSLEDQLRIVPRFEQIFRDSFGADTLRTLAVVCFPLGTRAGGIYTADCCRHLSALGYPIVTVTPGNNLDELLRVVQELGPHFEQVVLLGDPPFLADVVDTGLARGLAWPKYRIKLICGGELFSEEWRTLVGERAGMRDPCRSSAALYSTADAGVLGVETPLSICIRRFLARTPAAARDLFGEAEPPTLVQYDPFSRFLEVQHSMLLVTGDSGVPLVRYHLGDTGGLFQYEHLLGSLARWDFDPLAALERSGDVTIRRLPFAYRFGR
jgi:phenylacetate-CoA ligase